MENKQTGLKENWQQFLLLVVINGFVGAMIGMERSIFPEFAKNQFGITSNTAILSFILAFGLSKAIANYLTGRLANKYGRKKLLVFGWLLAIPVPLILLNAPNWSWVVYANLLMGLSQGLAWSSTVVMKIDLVGEKNRGLAMGINEFAGYFSVGLMAFITNYIAHKYGVTPYPFYLGLAVAIVGLILSVFWVKDTKIFLKLELSTPKNSSHNSVFWKTTFQNKTMSAVTLAGLVNNLNDGMMWGLLPVFLLSRHYGASEIGIVTAIYPAVWGIGQLFTGKMSDHFSKKRLLFWGMFLQGLVICWIPFSSSYIQLTVISILLGLGTAMVYPTFLSSIAQESPEKERAESIGTFRFWRDMGYVVGALLSGITADIFGLEAAIFSVGILTVLSSWFIQMNYRSTARVAAV